MERNKELRQAWDFVENTGKSVFLTGKAGTGKTTFLKAVKEHSHKRMVVVAPTGVAAINAGGVTIHSFFQLPLSPYVPGARLDQKYSYSKEKRKIIRTMDLLVIDEISMVRSDVLDAVDSVMRRFREHDKPFGGVQLVMIGDLHQLTPVVRNDEAQLLSKYYDTPYFFGSNALKMVDYVTIELHHVFRQQDDEFLAILNDIRDGHPTNDDLQKLNSRYEPSFRPPAGSGYIRLTTHNRIADDYNEKQLWALQSKAFSFDAKIEGDFQRYDYPTDMRLTLKTGSQVMFLKNDPKGRYYNGRIGNVTYVDQQQIIVLCPGDEKAIEVERETWESTKYKLNEQTRQIESDVVGTFTQYPLRLAWAITIHKSQGLTFDHAIIDAQLSFASGQVYVALSRCRTLAGLVLASPIQQSAIINDARVSNYISNQDAKARDSIERLPRLKQEYYKQLLTESFNFQPVLGAESALDRVMQEFFYGKTPLAPLHHTALEELRKKIIPTADKWTDKIAGMSDTDAHDSVFLERVKRGAAYFAGQLSDIFDDIMRRTGLLQTNNKMVKKRLEHAYSDMHDIWLAKFLVLEKIAEKGFTPQNYLKYKQESVLEAMDSTSAKPRRKGATGTKVPTKTQPEVIATESVTPKRAKGKTREISLNMYKQGKTVVEIARDRNLKESTIFNHLLYYVERGELPAETILPQRHRETIERVIKNIGTENGMKPIKNLCPPEITWDEIRTVMKLMNKENAQK